MKKLLLAAMLSCMLLSIIAMLFPNAYIVASCVAPLEGDWRIPYSYFEISLAGKIYWVEDVLGLCIRVLALICNSIFVFRLIFKKLNIIPFIFFGLGLLTSLLSLGTSTADGFPNQFPFITAITAVCIFGLLVFHLFSGKLAKFVCFMILIGVFASAFSLIMSHLLTIAGVIITGLYLLTIIFYIIYIRYPKSI